MIGSQGACIWSMEVGGVPGCVQEQARIMRDHLLCFAYDPLYTITPSAIAVMAVRREKAGKGRSVIIGDGVMAAGRRRLSVAAGVPVTLIGCMFDDGCPHRG